MSQNSFFRKKITWILIAYGLFQIAFITYPPLDAAHNWRQTVTAMIARNMVQQNGSLLYPEVDYLENGNGIIATEFPFMQGCISVCIKLFGFQHWYGRLVNLIAVMTAYLALYFLIKRYSSESMAVYSVLGLMFSLWFVFGRDIMPDTFSVSLVIVSLWFFSEYMEKGNYWSLFIGSVLLSLGVLSKIPALVPVASLLFFLLGNYPIQKKVLLCFAVILSLMPVYWWYFKWVPHLISLNQKPLFFPRSLREGFFEIMEYKSAVIEQFTFHTFFAFSGFILAVGGVVLLIKKHLKIELLVLVALSFTMILFIFKTGNVFPRHSYYMVPFAPVMAVLLGYLLHNIPHKWAIGLLAVFIIESVANQHHDFLRRPTREYLLNLEEMANGFSDRNMKIVCNGGENPQLIYFINRRGWSVETSTITNKSLKNWMDKDAQFLFIDKTKGVVEETILFPKIISTKEVDVYRLK